MPSLWNEGDVVLEDYRVESRLGPGGMGQVYLVRSATTGTRFAVKRTLIREPAAQRRFLAELLTWFNLPIYPHFTACQFFRTIAGELAIFAEFVSGGSLKSWITAGRIAETHQILDVAIQTAWALYALHESKLIHRDVKPANILMDLDGTAKLTDFGLSKAWPASVADGPGPERLTPHDGTFEYCSPEQFKEEPANTASDVWSWGLSVLEMFKGSATWGAGFMALEVLTDHVRKPRGGESPIPSALVGILGRCFQDQPEARWQNMAEVADLLMDIYRAETGSEYPRRPPHPLAPQAAEFPSHDRQSLIGVAWDDPEPWLRESLKLDGRDPAEAKGILLESKGTRKAQAIADLAAFEETERILAGLVDRGTDHLKRSLAKLLAEKALVHINVDDVPGAHALLDRAAYISSQLNSLEDRADSIRASLNKALLFEQSRQYERAKELYEILIPRMEAIVQESAAPDLLNDLAKLYHNLANTLDELDQKSGAIDLNGRAIEIRTALVERHPLPDFIRDLAMTQASQATLYRTFGQAQKAFDDFELALAMYRRITHEETLSGPVLELATAMLNQASAALHLNRDAEAAQLCDKAVSLMERLVQERGAVEAEPALSRAYFNRMAAYGLIDPPLAYESVESAIRILHRLVSQEGRGELAPDLERAYAAKGQMVLAFEAAAGGEVIEPAGHDPAAKIKNQAMALERAGDLSGTMVLYDAAIRTYLAARSESPSAFEGELAVTRINKAAVASAAGEDHDAVLLCDEAIAALSVLAQESGLAEVIEYLETAFTIKAQAAARRKDSREELSNYSKQVELLSRVAVEDGRWQCRFHLARTCRNLAIAAARGGDVERAVAVCEEASAILRGIREKAAAPAVSDVLAEVRSLAKELKRRGQYSFAKQLRAKLESSWRRWRWPATRTAPSRES
jgi:serine/threonine protein kinase